MKDSILDWDLYFRRHKYFPSQRVKPPEKKIVTNKKLGLTQKEIASIMASWRHQNL